jgi:hypothetical protein
MERWKGYTPPEEPSEIFSNRCLDNYISLLRDRDQGSELPFSLTSLRPRVDTLARKEFDWVFANRGRDGFCSDVLEGNTGA